MYANGKEWMKFFCFFLFTKRRRFSTGFPSNRTEDDCPALQRKDGDVSVLRIVHGGRDLGHCLMADRDGNKPAING